MKPMLTAGASALAWLTAGIAPPPAAPPAAAPIAIDAAPGSPAPRLARLPGFAPELADRPRIAGPADWAAGRLDEALAALAAAPGHRRQAARWGYARALIAGDRVADASGVLEVMLADDPDLALVESFQLARGLVFTRLGRFEEALAALDRPGLAGNAEACAWRLRALAGAGADLLALRQLDCARAAISARPAAARAPFVTVAADSALALARPDLAMRIAGALPDGDPAANLRRGRALLALGRLADADIRFGRAHRASAPEIRIAAELGRIETGLARGRIGRAAALTRVEKLRYGWRGDAIERQALWLAYRLAREGGDHRAALAAGATLVRYHPVGPKLGELTQDLQARLAALLAPETDLPIDRAAGLYWQYRDLGPSGAEGDRLVVRLADRLQSVGLYARGAELLEHQLLARAQDLAQGPLSVRVAKLHILSGRPDRALEIMRATSRTLYPSEMLWDRQRMEAIALHQLGRGEEALAVLQEIPDAAGLRAELLWKQRRWAALIDAAQGALPPPDGLSEVRQASLLRLAIALGMLGREGELQALRDRYAEAFAPLPTGRAFDLLTRSAGGIDPDVFAQAMAAIPAVSPAGALADLIDAAPAAAKS